MWIHEIGYHNGQGNRLGVQRQSGTNPIGAGADMVLILGQVKRWMEKIWVYTNLEVRP